MGIATNKPRWYVAGLAFECTGCGRCCAGPAEGYVWVSDEEITAIAGHLNMPVGQFRKKYVRQVGRRASLVEDRVSRDCVFLSTGADGKRGCTVYPVRPQQCRTWPFWSGNLTDADTWSLAGLRCPGVNRGPTYDYDEIERRRKATH